MRILLWTTATVSIVIDALFILVLLHVDDVAAASTVRLAVELGLAMSAAAALHAGLVLTPTRLASFRAGRRIVAVLLAPSAVVALLATPGAVAGVVAGGSLAFRVSLAPWLALTLPAYVASYRYLWRQERGSSAIAPAG